MEANDAFHDVIIEASGNRRLREAIKFVFPQLPRELIWAGLGSNSWMLRVSADEHAHIRERIAEHDGPGARKAMTEHIRAAGEFMGQRAEILAETAEPAEPPS
jgi:DNA-binding GntR family transcriptional regulator